MIKKILLGIVIVVVVLVAVIAILAALQPTHYRIERSATINAPASVVFAQVNDFHKWEAWSPWAKIDPAMKQAYEGTPSGTGAIYTWAGNNQVGEGRMTITESHPSDLIKIKLEFIKPWSATNATDFAFKPQGNQTAVTWTMEGDNNFMGKAFGLFMNMDKMVGGDFEKGLAQMKSVAETVAKQ
ncbi:MAG: polyketide cyclase [Acidobacteria bacterium]|nr:MAG: polyketide cyclase [Acidobacteriota bacterium]